MINLLVFSCFVRLSRLCWKACRQVYEWNRFWLFKLLRLPAWFAHGQLVSVDWPRVLISGWKRAGQHQRMPTEVVLGAAITEQPEMVAECSQSNIYRSQVPSNIYEECAPPYILSDLGRSSQMGYMLPYYPSSTQGPWLSQDPCLSAYNRANRRMNCCEKIFKNCLIICCCMPRRLYTFWIY